MVVKVEKSDYKKELFSLPVGVVEALKNYAQETGKKKSHIVAEAIEAYVAQNKKEKYIQEAKSIIGIMKGPVPDIQEIKAHRYDND